MKVILTILALALACIIKSQSINSFESKWIHDEQNTMIFYSVKDSIKTVIGEVENKIKINNGIIVQLMTFTSEMFNNDFVDVTEYRLHNLKPIFHTSSNDQRFLTVVYGDTIHAIYRNVSDKALLSYTETINNTLCYYESSVYQNIIRWLPLTDGYKSEFDIYNYDPNNISGILDVQITEVISGKYLTKNSGVRDVWRVTEVYENGRTVHFIDKVDRKLWKQEFNGGKLVMIRKE